MTEKTKMRIVPDLTGYESHNENEWPT